MNIGIIGCGSVAKAHVNALQKLKTVNKIYVHSHNYEKASLFAQKFKNVIVYDSLEKMILIVEGVIIATPNNTHLDLLKNILLIKSIPVLCEKPLASSLGDATKFNQLAPPLSIIGFNYRFNPIISDILMLKQREALGEFVFVNIEFNTNSAIVKKNITWKDNINQSNSSGVFGDLSSHLFDLVQYVTKSSIVKDTLRLSLGTKIPFRGDVKLVNDDYSVAAGLTNSRICFKVKSTKAALDHDLGFHLHLIFEQGELYYSTTNPNNIRIERNNKLGMDHISLEHSKLIEDPEKEIPYWSDSFYFQDQAWVEAISKKKLSQKLATISDGLEIQKLISMT